MQLPTRRRHCRTVTGNRFAETPLMVSYCLARDVFVLKESFDLTRLKT